MVRLVIWDTTVPIMTSRYYVMHIAIQENVTDQVYLLNINYPDDYILCHIQSAHRMDKILPVTLVDCAEMNICKTKTSQEVLMKVVCNMFTERTF